jgi:hypothetical protein
MLTLMIIVSDNTATDVMFDKVGGVDSVNRLVDSYGLKATRATFPSEVWFKNLRAAPSAEQFHFEGKTPYGLSSPRDMGLMLGEYWDMTALAADCAADGVYEFQLVAPPLRVTGGVGSPLNPIALK